MSFTIVQLREEVALKVRYRMQESVGEFVEEHHEEFGLTKSSFHGYLSSVRAGKKIRSTTNASKGFGYSKLEVERLSKLFEILGMPERESLLQKVREYSVY